MQAGSGLARFQDNNSTPHWSVPHSASTYVQNAIYRVPLSQDIYCCYVSVPKYEKTILSRSVPSKKIYNGQTHAKDQTEHRKFCPSNSRQYSISKTACHLVPTWLASHVVFAQTTQVVAAYINLYGRVCLSQRLNIGHQMAV